MLAEEAGFDVLRLGSVVCHPETCSCTLWVPIDVVKERLQTQQVLPPELRYKGSWHAVTSIVSLEGVSGLYRGTASATLHAVWS